MILFFMGKILFRLLSITLLIILLVSCPNRIERQYARKYSLTGEMKPVGELIDDIFSTEEAKKRFALCDQAIGELQEAGKEETLIHFMDDYLNVFPNDPYKAYYLTLYAEYYYGREAFPIVVDYYRRILYTTQDLILDGQSIHLLVLKKWLTLSESVEDRITIYELLISNFPDDINRGECYYFLAKSYDEVGDFDNSLVFYELFLNEPKQEIPGTVEAYEEVNAMINFHYSDKSWTFKTLNDLVNAVKYAIGSRKIYLLDRYQSDNFFILSWSQKMMNLDDGVTIGDLTSYQYTRIYYSPTLESFSNNKEAYLKTWGWSYRVKPWYLYFRKINYPRDPEINGRWEWVGIYMGQPL